jgi:hypothetical protein
VKNSTNLNPIAIIIDDSSTVRFDGTLTMGAGSRMELRSGAVLHLKRLDANSGAEIIMHSGSTIF